jgi:hypothetical protein
VAGDLSDLAIDVHLGPVAASLEGASACGVLWQATQGRFLLAVPGVGRYLVEDGTTITVDPEEGAEPAEVTRFLHGTPVMAVYLQRGSPVLHAAVVAPAASPDAAIVLAGDSSVGKSVLAATLWARGYEVLADELAPIAIDGGSPVIVPTADEVVLWPDAVEQLSGRHQGASPLDSQLSPLGPVGLRRRLAVSNRLPGRTRAVRAIWWLRTHNLDHVDVTDVRGAARFDCLGAMAANSRVAAAILRPDTYWAVAGALAASATPVRRLVRPRGRWCADELADLVENNCGA